MITGLGCSQQWGIPKGGVAEVALSSELFTVLGPGLRLVTSPVRPRVPDPSGFEVYTWVCLPMPGVK